MDTDQLLDRVAQGESSAAAQSPLQSPVPEPNTLALVALIGIAMQWNKRRIPRSWNPTDAGAATALVTGEKTWEDFKIPNQEAERVQKAAVSTSRG